MSTRTAGVRRIAGAALLMIVSSAACAQGLGLYSAITAKKLGDAYMNFLDIAATKQALQNEVVQARLRYWQLYPSGAGLNEAGQAYALALQKKDLFFFEERIVNVAMRNMGLDNLGAGDIWGAVDLLSGGPVDGGIHPYAAQQFSYWFGAAYSKEAFGLGTAFTSVQQSERQYLDYVRMRDLSEFLFRNPKTPLNSQNDVEYLAAVMVATKIDLDYAQAQRRAKDIARMSGAAQFAAGVAKLRTEAGKDKWIEKELRGEARARSSFWSFKRYYIQLQRPACPDLSKYPKGQLYTLANVPAAQRAIKFTDVCGAHDINYVLAAYSAMNAARPDETEHSPLIFRDSTGAAYVAGFDDRDYQTGGAAQASKQFVVLPIPVKEMSQRVGSSQTAPPNPNELAKMSDAELAAYMANRANKPSESQNAATLFETFSRDYPSYRLVQTSYSGGWRPTDFVNAASSAPHVGEAVWERGD